MNVSDYIWQYLADKGVGHVFYLAGGGSMHLIDALARQDRITPVAMLHEQSCAIAAAAYAMYKNDLGVACVTTGPGGTNAITGVEAAWTDYVTLLVISGQVPTHLRRREGERQRGPQEADVLGMTEYITKYQHYAYTNIRRETGLEWAVHEALEHPRGPSWIDVPLDVQGAPIE